MALDWSPITLAGFQASEQAKEAGECFGSLALGPGIAAAFGKHDLTAKSPEEYFTALGRTFHQESDSTKDWGAFVKGNPLLDYIINDPTANLKYDASGSLTYWDESAKEFKGWKTQGGRYDDIISGGKHIGLSPGLLMPFSGEDNLRYDKDDDGHFTGKIEYDKRTPFERYIDQEWATDMTTGGALNYRTPKSMLGALMDKDWTYRSGKDTGKNIFKNVGDYIKGRSETHPFLGLSENIPQMPFSPFSQSPIQSFIDKFQKAPSYFRQGGNLAQALDPISQLAYRHAGIGKPQIGRDYIVTKAGDTWSSLAQGTRFSAEELARLNGMDTNTPLQIDQEVVLNERTAKKFKII